MPLDDEPRRVKYYDHRVTHNYEKAINRLENGKWRLYCLHDSTVVFLRKYLTLASWQSTWIASWHRGYYLTPTQAELDEFLSTFNDYANKGLEPMCGEIVQAIKDLTAVIAKKNCGGCGGCGDQPGGPTVDPPTANGQEPGGPGPGGGSIPEDWQNDSDPTTAYNAYKCQAANMIVDGIIKTMSNCSEGLSSISSRITFGKDSLVSILQGLIATGLMLTPLLMPELLFVLVGYMIGLEIGGELTSEMFDDLKTDLEASKDDAVCNLYNALTVADARAALVGWFQTTALDYIPSLLVGKFVDLLTTNNVLNVLFEKNANVETYTASTVDCVVCGGGGNCTQITTNVSNFTVGSNFIQAESAFVGGNHYQVVVWLYVEGTPPVPACSRTITSIEIVSGTWNGTDAHSILKDGSGHGAGSNYSELIGDCAQSVWLDLSSTPFTVRITFGNEC